MSGLELLLAAISHVGYAAAVHATPLPVWFPHRPISCGFCLTTWFGAMWWICSAANGLPLYQAAIGMGLSIVAGAAAAGFIPWAFRPEKQPG
jgi:hypothetical protein